MSAELNPRTRRLVFGMDETAMITELDLITHVDLAHLSMLASVGLLGESNANQLATLIGKLRTGRYGPLNNRPAPRGLYLMYESYLISELGEEIGGILPTGRSRNDLKATTTALRLRSMVIDFVSDAVRLQAILLGRARAYHDVVMPVYTHFQPAMPVTYGYYLLGVALALDRDIEAVRQAAKGLRRCPLGACAVAGTDLPIDPEITAAFLGFETGPEHAIDTVASRDTLLHVLSGVAGVGITIGRLATDLQLWSTSEFGLVEFPDHLVGGSSAMPQKRNAFLLEHLKAKASAAIGAWTASASAIKSTPFTNSIEVGTEAVAMAWPGLQAVATALLIAQAVVAGAKPVRPAMAARASDGFTVATAIANRLVCEGVPFRAAHFAVGAAVRSAIEARTTTISEVFLPGGSRHVPDMGTDLTALVATTKAGGGPGSFRSLFAQARTSAAVSAEWVSCWRERLRSAAESLTASVRALGADIGSVIDAREQR